MFTRSSLHQTVGSHTRILKYLTMFFLGGSFVVLAAQGFNITTNIGNALQYIGKIVITSDGSSLGTTGIVLDGSSGNAFFSGDVGISGSISALTGSLGNLSVTTGSINNLTSNIGSIGNLNVTTGSINNLSVAQRINTQSLNGNAIYLSNTNTTLGLNCSTDDCFNEILFSTENFGDTFSIGTNEEFQENHIQGIANLPMIFSTNNIERMRIAANGNVGIGTGTPSQRLEVNGNIKLSQEGWIGTTVDQIAFGSNGNIGIGGFADSNKLRVHGSLYSDSFKNAQLTIGSNNITINPVDGGTPGYKMKIIGSNNNYGSAYELCTINNPNCKDGGDIVIVPGNSYADSDNGNIFLGFDNGSAVGKVGIGTGISSDTRLNIGGSIRVYGSGTFTNAVTAQAFFYSSDRRYKDNITLITDPLQKLLGLNGYTFNWKDTGRADIGVIAQEVEQVFPQAVATNAEGYKSVEYGNLVAPLIEAVKALYYKYLDQEARIKNLEQEILLLKSSLN